MSAPVSVVIPCYRCQDTIERAVALVATRTHLPAELMLIDDASDDETPRILHALQNRYGSDWVKVIFQQKNGGPGAARNAGWDVATQPYVAFLDADDAWHPLKIEIQLGHMHAHPELAITGHRSRWLRGREPVAPLPKDYVIKPVARKQMLISNRWSTPTVMLRKDLDYRFEQSKRYSEDYLLWLQILSNGHKGAFIDLDLAYLYKAPYGAGGLSGQMWQMEKGELDTYLKLRNQRLISYPTFSALVVWSLVKYGRRVVVNKLRMMRNEE